jgi:hypothetical protein
MSHDTVIILSALAASFTVQTCFLWCAFDSITTMLLKIQANEIERLVDEWAAKKEKDAP